MYTHNGRASLTAVLCVWKIEREGSLAAFYSSLWTDEARLASLLGERSEPFYSGSVGGSVKQDSRHNNSWIDWTVEGKPVSPPGFWWWTELFANKPVKIHTNRMFRRLNLYSNLSLGNNVHSELLLWLGEKMAGMGLGVVSYRGRLSQRKVTRPSGVSCLDLWVGCAR